MARFRVPGEGPAYGNNGKQATSDLSFARSVMVESHGQDKYTRTLGDTVLSGGTHVNRELVAEGWYWWCRKYAPEDVILAAWEAAARVARKGLWVDSSLMPPWERRKGAPEFRLQIA